MITLNAFVPDPAEHLGEAESAFIMALDGHFEISDTDAERDNLLRGYFAMPALRAFAEQTGLSNDDVPTIIGDLLADIRHLCDAAGLDYAELDGRGYRHYVAEVRGG